MHEWRFVIAAYAITWAVLIGYAVRLSLVNRRANALRDASVHAAPGATQ